MSEPEKAEPETVQDVEEEDDVETIDTSEDGPTDSQAIAAQLMKNPGVLAALQDRLSSIVGSPSGYIQSLPKEVKRRIKALKKLQFSIINVESEFYKEVNELEAKYADKYKALFDKRHEVVNAVREPTDEECDWPSDEEDEDEEGKLAPDSQQDEAKDKLKIEDAAKDGSGDGEDKKPEEETKGIPSFWLTIFKNVDMLSEMVQEHDEPILTCLQDIKVNVTDNGFVLEFLFDANDYFTNTSLTKTYEMRYEPDPEDPFQYEGPEIIKCSGCKIDWKKDKNVTVKQVKKKQKHKGKGQTRVVTKQVQADSFFNFFNPPTVPEGSESEVDEETEALLGADFEIGHFIRERIVPRAVLFFTGEAIDNDEYDEDEENEEGEDDDYDEDGDPDFNPETAGKPNECKQS